MELVASWKERGVAGPVRVFSPGQAARLAWLLEGRRWVEGARSRLVGAPPLKSIATRSALYHRLAVHPTLLGLVTERLGPDVLLWGASVVIAPARARHAWHVDVETSLADPGQTLSVWIPLSGGGPGSVLQVLPGSHRLQMTVQEARVRQHVTPAAVERDGPEVLAARLGSTTAAVESFEARPGEAVLFDGRLWHASANDRPLARRALLLHYAVPDASLRTVAPDRYEWPFEFGAEGPRCLLVSGTDRSGSNLVVPPPAGRRRHGSPLAPRIEELDRGPAPDGFRSQVLFSGASASGLHVIAHVSTLAPGCTPHSPHTHPEEEVLVLLEGALDVVLVDGRGARRVERLEAGGVLHYPLDQRHTITGAGETAARYVILKWRGARLKRRSGVLPAVLTPRVDPDATSLLATRVEFEGPTRYLRRLQCHRSTLPVGGGYGEHADAYEVAIVTLDGTVETLGQRVEPHSLVWYPMGSRHGLRNVGSMEAHYVVVELHGDTVGSRLNPARLRELLRRVGRLPARLARVARGSRLLP